MRALAAASGRHGLRSRDWHRACNFDGFMATQHEELRLRNGWVSHRTTEDPTVTKALERVFEASQSLVVRQLELLLEKARTLVLHALAAVAGILLAAGGWALLIFGALQNLETGLPRLLAFTAVGSAHLILGACVVYRSLRDVGEEPR
jgi:hypothetical protein